MAVSLQDQLVVAISSRALFDFEAENRVFDEDPAAYVRLQRERLDVPAAPGVALPLVRKLLAFNQGGSGGWRWCCSRAMTRSAACACFAAPKPMGWTAFSAACLPRGETRMPICGRWGRTCSCLPMRQM